MKACGVVFRKWRLVRPGDGGRKAVRTGDQGRCLGVEIRALRSNRRGRPPGGWAAYRPSGPGAPPAASPGPKVTAASPPVARPSVTEPVVPTGEPTPAPTLSPTPPDEAIPLASDEGSGAPWLLLGFVLGMLILAVGVVLGMRKKRTF